MKLTPAQLRALEAVRDGKAYHIYRGRGNTMHCKGVGSATLWKLETQRLIRDGRADNPGAMQIRCPLELTDVGRRWLWENPS